MRKWTEIYEEALRMKAREQTNEHCESGESAPEEVRTGNEESTHKTHQRIAADIHDELEASRTLWKGVCFELAGALAYPRAPLKPARVGYVGAGEANWRIYLKMAPLVELKHIISPYLRQLVIDEQFTSL